MRIINLTESDIRVNSLSAQIKSGTSSMDFPIRRSDIVSSINPLVQLYGKKIKFVFSTSELLSAPELTKIIPLESIIKSEDIKYTEFENSLNIQDQSGIKLYYEETSSTTVTSSNVKPVEQIKANWEEKDAKKSSYIQNVPEELKDPELTKKLENLGKLDNIIEGKLTTVKEELIKLIPAVSETTPFDPTEINEKIDGILTILSKLTDETQEAKSIANKALEAINVLKLELGS